MTENRDEKLYGSRSPILLKGEAPTSTPEPVSKGLALPCKISTRAYWFGLAVVKSNGPPAAGPVS